MKSSALRMGRGPLRLLALLSAVLSLLLLAAPAAAADNNKYAAIVVDGNSGKTLFARNADARRYPASLTKMMTLYLLFEELEAQHLSMGTGLSVSANAARQAPSKLGVRAGSKIKVEDAILALVTKSANDVAVVVAEHIGGSVSGFAARMNRAARALGMSQTTFRNPHGLPDSGQVTTARDLVRLARALQDKFPTYYEYFGKKSFTYRGVRHRNHNRLLGSVEGVDGIKTGYTRASGFNLVTNVERGGRHIIVVVLGGKSASSRDAHMRELIAKYLPKATRGGRTAPELIVETTAEALLAEARLPRSRPAGEAEDDTLLAYAPNAASDDVVAIAMAEAEAEEQEGDVGEAPEDDPIAHRIQSASSIAEFADISLDDGGAAEIAKLTELVRIRAGVQDIIASAPLRGDDSSSAADDAGWHIQIGAVPTETGAHELIEKAQTSMGALLASLQPLTQQVDKGGTTLYRARFGGFSDKEEARDACVKLKRKSFSCLAVPN